MSVKYWISSGEFEQFENCKTEQQLFDGLEKEFRPFREKIGDVIFVDENGSVFSAEVAFVLVPAPMPDYVQAIDDDDIEIVEVAVCQNCLSEKINEFGICLDCGHVGLPDGAKPVSPKLTSGRSH